MNVSTLRKALQNSLQDVKNITFFSKGKRQRTDSLSVPSWERAQPARKVLVGEMRGGSEDK